MTGTSGRQRVPTDSFDHLTVPIPPLPEQRAIAHILGTLDDKIELNRRMSETLEQMARALFKAWFVDFEPVRAKMEGRWRRGESLPGLPAHLYDLFPDRLVDSELGEIPEGWRVGTVDEEFDLTMGQSPPGDTYNEIGDGVPFYQGSSDFGFRFPTRRMYCTAPTRLAKAGDTLVSVRASVGDINMFPGRMCHRAWRCCRAAQDREPLAFLSLYVVYQISVSAVRSGGDGLRLNWEKGFPRYHLCEAASGSCVSL
jgi:Restriction endonuclease S subunits